MFKFILVILSYTADSVPDPIATFKTQQHCEAVAYIINDGFKKQVNNANKAVCIVGRKFGDA